MTLNLSKPILYLITRGATTEATTPDSEEFQQILKQVSAAVTAGVQLIQLREKQLPAQVLFELTAAVVSIARGSSTRILVNDRADVAAGAGADGVHLTTHSLTSDTIRNAFGAKFLIGASTHSLLEAREASRQGADFAVFGPIFPSPAKAKYGAPLGLEKLSEAARGLTPFPLIALGGVSLENANQCLLAGASGIAGITLFGDPNTLSTTVETLRDRRQFHLHRTLAR
ncbi:MAG: thiamine-phosphate pyrophosphorylase [Blastocatellia bacterium]|jgi:thiamine-phosphate pyrophosphorylase|nr:thiamine-phosphate pyrophosphorylase [Blastocatellia bacterium]